MHLAASAVARKHITNRPPPPEGYSEKNTRDPSDLLRLGVEKGVSYYYYWWWWSHEKNEREDAVSARVARWAVHCGCFFLVEIKI